MSVWENDYMKFLKFLDDHLEEFICIVALAAMTAVIFIQIILRLEAIYLCQGNLHPVKCTNCSYRKVVVIFNENATKIV